MTALLAGDQVTEIYNTYYKTYEGGHGRCFANSEQEAEVVQVLRNS